MAVVRAAAAVPPAGPARGLRGGLLSGILVLRIWSAVAFVPKDSAHCLRWVADVEASEIRAEGKYGAPRGDDPALCRLAPGPSARPSSGSAAAAAAASAEDRGSFADTCAPDLREAASIGTSSRHLAVGIVRRTASGELGCVPIAQGPAAGAASDGAAAGAAEAGAVEFAVVDPGCDVWWREVSADVIPPIPELVLALGATNSTPGGHRLGLCRTFGDRPEVDGGRRLVGTAVLEGPDFGRCFFTREDGTRGHLDGGMFHVLQARAAEPSCVHDEALAADLSSSLGRRMDTFLSADDAASIERVAGSPFADLRTSVLSLGSCELRQVMSPARFVPSPLNVGGLHLLRALLAERMADARAEAAGLDAHPDYAAWRRDGVLIKDFDEVGDEGLHGLLQMASGEREEAIPPPPYRWTVRNVTLNGEWDPQNDMHIDTFASIVKVWIFDGSVTPDHGPLEYVPGSHRETEPRLRWMHAYGLPPAKEALVEPSFRLLGSPAAAAAAADFVEACRKRSTPVLPLPGARRTLVIADTSGLHRRSEGEPGRTRVSWRLAGDNDGGLRRLDPYRWPTGGAERAAGAGVRAAASGRAALHAGGEL